MPASPQLDGRVAIVTGGSRGIGFAIASALLSRGARVAIAGRDPGHLKEAEGRLQTSGGSAKLLTVQADVSQEADAERLIARATDTFGGLDILINNAGIARFANVADMSTEAWASIFDTNVTGVFFCTRAALPHLKRRGGGWIINISSLAGTNPFAGAAAYCASKAALDAFTQALMLEVRYDNIRVSTIAPGSVKTGFAGNQETDADDWKLAAEDIAEVTIDLIAQPARSLPSRIEMRPAKPKKR